MMTSGIPVDPDGEPIRNDPGAVVVRAYRVEADGVTLRDIGGALVAPHILDRLSDVAAAMTGIIGQEIVRLIIHDVYGAPDAPTATSDGAAPEPPPDVMSAFLEELGDAPVPPDPSAK